MFKGGNREDWPLPAAHYEMAVLAWIDVQNPELHLENGAPASGPAAEKRASTWGFRAAAPAKETAKENSVAEGEISDEEKEEKEKQWRRAKIDECQSWLETVSKWESYILENRLGVRINTGLDTIKWYRNEHTWAK